jgi:hypothetical protein
VYDEKEESNCVYVILNLLNLYRQAKESNPGSFEDLMSIKELSPDSIERLSAEKS